MRRNVSGIGLRLAGAMSRFRLLGGTAALRFRRGIRVQVNGTQMKSGVTLMSARSSTCEVRATFTNNLRAFSTLSGDGRSENSRVSAQCRIVYARRPFRRSRSPARPKATPSARRRPPALALRLEATASFGGSIERDELGS